MFSRVRLSHLLQPAPVSLEGKLRSNAFAKARFDEALSSRIENGAGGL